MLEFAKKTMRPLVVIAHDFSSEALTSMVVNKLQLNLKVVAVKAPMLQCEDVIEDISAFSGATVLGDQYSVMHEPIGKVDPVRVLGKISGATLSKTETVLRGTNYSQKVEERIQFLQNYTTDNILLSDFEQDLINERIGKLQGGLCLIKAGGISKMDVQETRDRIEDSLFAVKAALQEGYVVGAGMAIIEAANRIDDEGLSPSQKLGFNIIKRACREPALQIVENAMGDRGFGHSVLQKYKKPIGFNSRSKQFENLIEAGVIDPVKVVMNSIEFSSGVASLLLTAEVAVVNERMEHQFEHSTINV